MVKYLFNITGEHSTIMRKLSQIINKIQDKIRI